MRLTTVVRKLLGVIEIYALDVRWEGCSLVIRVKPRWRAARCGECGKPGPSYDVRPPRLWRHLALGRFPFLLEYAPRRVDCPTCGVVTESVPWARLRSWFTKEFEEMTAYLTQRMDRTAVTRLMGTTWRTVTEIARRVVQERLDPTRLKNLYRIGVDEISFRRRHEYVTVVVDHATHRVVWTGEGKSGATLDGFFDELGEEGIRRLESVTMDMSQAYINCVTQRAPDALRIFDRFHVQRLAGDAVDEVRRAQMRMLAGTFEGKAIKNSRFALLKNPWNLTLRDHERLAMIKSHNAPLFRAYMLKEALAYILDRVQLWRARKLLWEWIGWARRSRLVPFITLAKTIQKHIDGILAYVETRLTNGPIEGLNNKTRLVVRRAFGLHSADAVGAMIMLCCGGIALDPPLPSPTKHA
jgi:transposase